MTRVANILILFQILYISPILSQPNIQAEIGSSKIKLGEQTQIKVSVTSSTPSDIEFMSFDSLQTTGQGIEVLSQKDTAYSSIKARVYTITSFDTATNGVPPIHLKIDGETYQTNELPLQVLNVPIDTTNVEKINDLKGSMEPAFDISEWIAPFYLSIILLCLGLLITYIIIRIKDNKPIIRRLKIQPYIPPHKAAMAEISKIRDEALWESGDSKDYYTRLTDVLRQYMQGRYGFNAMEMTTDEIIHSIENLNDPIEIRNLHALFTTADLVKFAKAHPNISENDKNLTNASNYIQSTKKEEVVEVSPKEVVVVDVRSQRAKQILYICIALTLIAMVFISFYLIKQILILNY